MTVKELIKKLQTRNPSFTVVLGCCQSSTCGHDILEFFGDGPNNTVILLTGIEIIDTEYEEDEEDEEDLDED